MGCPFDLSSHIPASPTTTTTLMIEGRERRFLATQQISVSPLSCAKPNRTAKRHVHFDDHDYIIPPADTPAISDEFTFEDDASTWYRVEELEKFRNEARDICREMKYHDELVHYADQGNSSDSDSSFSTSSHRLPSLARSSLTRGLEQRTCLERQRRKYLSNRFLLKVAPKLYQENPGKLAELAQKCNAWATDLALEEASRDYRRVYLSEDTVGYPSEALQPLPVCRKRSLCQADGIEHVHKRIRSTTSSNPPILQIFP